MARTDENLMLLTIECVKAHATLGEIVTALKEVFGLYRAHRVLGGWPHCGLH